MSEPARAGRALLGPDGPPRAAFGVWAACSAVTIALAAYGGLWPTSLVERGAEGALPPRPTECGLQSGRAARLRRSHRDPLARSPAAPARIPPPGSPGLADGQGP